MSKIDYFQDMEIRDNLRTNNGWSMRSDHILRIFGLSPSGPIPPNYSAGMYIRNVLVEIHPRGALRIKRRVVAHCPKCQKIVCAGHLEQHMKVHNGEERRI